jgi:hypothetical protein
MTRKYQLKTYLASFCAVQMIPGIIVTEQPGNGLANPRAPGGAVLSCEVDWKINSEGRFAAVFGHHARLLVRYEETEAMEFALREAHRYLPVEDGWTGHSVTLTEVPRARFIEMQLSITAREIYYRILRLTGFRPST